MNKKNKVLTIGDGLITMNPLANGPLRFVTNFERKMGGAELNFAIGMSRLGIDCKWISRLGADEFGRAIYNFARGEGVDVSEIKYEAGFPTSLNFKQINGDGSGETFYYRDNSPITRLNAHSITDEMLEDVTLVHVTGVFLSIYKESLEVVETLLKKAQEKGITVSFDPNLRLKMWTIKEARTTFESIYPYVDIMLTGLDELKLLTEKNSKDDFLEFAKEHNIKDLVIKDGGNGAALLKDGSWSEYEAFKVNVIDTVGAGDGFNVGYIYGYLNDFDRDETMKYANGIGALVTTVSGDNEGLPYKEQLEAFINDEQIIER